MTAHRTHRKRDVKRDVVTMAQAFMAAYIAQPQPCFYGCGAMLPKDDSPESTALRREHMEDCPCAPIGAQRAAVLINDARRVRDAQTQGV